MSLLISGALLAQQKPPVFRTRVDLLQLDVTVLDKTGKPVRGLTQDDFIVLEDKQPQTIQAFTAVDIPETPPPAAVWANTVAPDVTTNEDESQRIFVIVIDDALGMGLDDGLMPDLWAIREMKKTVALFIESLSPVDAVALVYSNGTRESQNLTTDHARLVKAIQAYPEDGGGILAPSKVNPGGGCLGKKYSRNTIGAVVDHLATIPDRRKAIVYWGGLLPFWPDDECAGGFSWDQILLQAQQAHVTINPIDTMGLRMHMGASDKYRSLAAETGGHAVVDSNDFAPGIKQIFLENSSYYLMAYAPTHDAEDGTFRRVSVAVKGHPEFDVRTRRSYWAEKHRPTDAAAPEPPPNIAALAGVLPDSKLPLRATAAAFASPGGDGAVVAISLGVRQPAVDARTPEQVDLLVKAFTADGDERGSNTDSIAITIPAARRDADTSRYELISRMELSKPGKYQLRLSAHSSISDSRGSVYVDVEVPDFKKDRVSFSGVILNSALAAAPTAPARVLRDLTSLVPTTERSFVASDIVTAFLRVYQGGGDKLAPVPVKVTMTDSTGKSVFSATDAVGPDRFAVERAADYQFRLPLATLTAGDYLLTFETMMGKQGARRDVRFTVK